MKADLLRSTNTASKPSSSKLINGSRSSTTTLLINCCAFSSSAHFCSNDIAGSLNSGIPVTSTPSQLMQRLIYGYRITFVDQIAGTCETGRTPPTTATFLPFPSTALSASEYSQISLTLQHKALCMRSRKRIFQVCR